jgi:hypothetical protein
MDYAELGIALAVAGVGISLGFPVVANVVFGSVPPNEAAIASGTNSTRRELGGVFGRAHVAADEPFERTDVAGLAAAFSRHGVHSSREAFVGGLTTALWVGAGLSALGIAAALPTLGHERRREQASQPAIAVASERA